ncbi:MAG: DUF551 domain-containing protein [Clostridium sp.]
MERLTIPDKKIPGGTRRTIIDTRAVREEAMKLYWALKKYEDTGLSPEEVERLKESKRWIPVEERPPEEDTIVLLTVSGLYSCIIFSDAIELGNLCSDGEWFIEGYPDWDDPNVTAWMPLPEPYQGKKG